MARLGWGVKLGDRRGIQERRVGLGGGLNRLRYRGCLRRYRGEGVVGGDEGVVMDVGEGGRFEEAEREGS